MKGRTSLSTNDLSAWLSSFGLAEKDAGPWWISLMRRSWTNSTLDAWQSKINGRKLVAYLMIKSLCNIIFQLYCLLSNIRHAAWSYSRIFDISFGFRTRTGFMGDSSYMVRVQGHCLVQWQRRRSKAVIVDFVQLSNWFIEHQIHGLITARVIQ